MRLMLALAALALAAACTQAPASPGSSAPDAQSSGITGDFTAEAASADVTGLASAGNAFGFALYRELAKAHGNVVVSPYSASGAFALLYPGADGAARAEIGRVLGFAAVDAGAFPAAMGTLNRQVASETAEARFAVANAAWVAEAYALSPGYRDMIAGGLGAQIAPVNFVDAAAAARTINTWVEAQTNDRIKELVKADMFSDATRLVLTNAVWFKADWAQPFDAYATNTGDFFGPTGAAQPARLMNQELTVPFLDGADFQAVSLDYVGGQFSMAVILPKTRDGLPALEARLDPAEWANLLGALDAAEAKTLQLTLPKLKTESGFDLIAPLKALGMTQSFEPDDANFPLLFEQPMDLFISDVVQKTFLEIDEKGTEAAAATAIVVTEASAPMPPEIKVRADHPYLIVLRETSTGAVLFLGRIEDPVAPPD